ncbi:trypsin alpha-3-like [Macrosteles quadrilineatus]|uniref:trypsin alpha-3-like n=1 Tax=Macrosteles quadrilineatus TaxID=74068 RepID=UPI0023E1D74D|nr:trypsin alpha-3-like [Macrosteles quadrilineatus]
MAPIVAIVTVLLFFSASDAASHESSAVFIIGGNSTDIKQHPYQVAIWSNKEFRGSGALVTKHWAISTASILVGFDADTLVVRALSSLAGSGGEVFNVSKKLIHPRFRFSNMTFDVALLRLRRPFMTSSSADSVTSLSTIPLARTSLPFDSTAVLSGWGSTTKTAKMSDQLLQTSVSPVCLTECQQSYERRLLRTVFCAAADHVYGPCWGDSGDLLVYNGKLYGLLSWNQGCYDQAVPSVFTDIHKVRPWVFRAIRRHSHQEL